MRITSLLLAAIFALCAAVFCPSLSFAATDGVYTLAETTAAWDGTDANRLKAPSGDYDHTYGDEASLAYTLPWPFTFYGQSYSLINIDTNGNIWFTATGSAHSFSLATTGRGPVISAWNNDLSSNYYGGAFVQHKSNPERVVVQWQTESYTDEGEHRLNDMEAVLFPSGATRLDYKTFDTSHGNDFGSGISRGNGAQYLSLTSNVGMAPSLAGRSFTFTALCKGDFDYDGDVDGSDLAVFSADYSRRNCNASGAPLCKGDFDYDGDVDNSDLAVFTSKYGRRDCP